MNEETLSIENALIAFLENQKELERLRESVKFLKKQLKDELETLIEQAENSGDNKSIIELLKSIKIR